MIRFRTVGWCTLALVTIACGGGTATTGGGPGQALEWGLQQEPLALPSPPGSAYPQLTSSPRGAILSWLEQADEASTLKYSERTSSGWSTTRKVAGGPDWFVTAADVPSVLRLSNGTVVANWYPTTDESIEAYDIRLSYSKDDGQTWAPSFSPHHDGTKTQHGFTSLMELPGGGLGAVWLDGRDQELNTTDPLGGSMALYFASFDATWKQTAEQPINRRVCECCQTAAAVTSGAVVTAFRDRSPDEIRDIKVSRLEKGAWSPERAVHDDNWKIDACPINGPALSASGSRVALAWFTAPNDTGRAYAAFSQDAGRTWGEPIRLDDEASLGHVDVELMDDGSAIASWVEFANGRGQFRARRVAASGARSTAVDVPGAGRVSGYPRMARSGHDLIFAWTESEGGQQVKGAVAHLRGATAP